MFWLVPEKEKFHPKIVVPNLQEKTLYGEKTDVQLDPLQALLAPTFRQKPGLK